eukprot:TRINITY_DN7705_c0_g2_i1.p1 TRINITY_DN7705_c0_g2~~TRINITY_DN7705_c0_g2_i1.p1  ORF type:complete len:435 (+),score=74.62 TRINITY_DN7705_c0_g2_i1:56-1360(+)
MADATEQPTLQIPGYVLRKKLGDGQMTEVYKAKAVGSKASVAVKVFRSRDAMPSFRREVRYLSAVQGHQHVIRLASSFEAFPGCRVMVLELGVTDLHTLPFKRELAEAEAVDIMRGVLSALAHVHSLDVVHRDVKPENIAITKTGSPRLMDFGIAASLSDKLEMSRPCGTPEYMAPEMRSSKRYGTPVDMFAFGATFFYVLGKEVPRATKAMTEGAITAEARLRMISFDSKFDGVTEDSKHMIQWCMHETASWRADAASALTYPPFAGHSSGEEQQTCTSFEEQMRAASGANPVPPPKPPAHAARREQASVRPTPLLQRQDEPNAKAQVVPVEERPSCDNGLVSVAAHVKLPRPRVAWGANSVDPCDGKILTRNSGSAASSSKACEKATQHEGKDSANALIPCMAEALTRSTFGELQIVDEEAGDSWPCLEPEN